LEETGGAAEIVPATARLIASASKFMDLDINELPTPDTSGRTPSSS
jgi:hypothetical protein